MNRIKAFKIFIIIVFAFLLLRAFQLQIVLGDYYYQLSEGNRISLRPINAPRGKIIDRNGNVLASNKLSYNLYFLPNEIPPDLTVDEIFKELSKITEIKIDQLKDNYLRNIREKSPSAIILKRNISQEAMVIIKENSDRLPGILVKESSIRDYVYKDLAPHILGYVGEISLGELKNLTGSGYDYSGGDVIGKTGLEREYEVYLNGTEGIEQIEVNSLGQMVKSLGIKPPEPGNDLILNLDLELQLATEELLAMEFQYLRENAEKEPDLYPPTGAAAIVMDPDSGAILAMASMPDFNLEDFAGGISAESYKKLTGNSLNPLLNRPIMAAVPPGSIFKLVTGTAAIEELGIRGNTEFIDKNGQFFIPDWSRPFNNWHQGGEGRLAFTRAIGRSNNVIFYELGYRLYENFGGEKLASYGRKYGLGSKTGVDLPGEKAGLVPDEAWKRSVFNEGWYPGDSVNLSIGQGSLLTTPLQLINMVSAIANGGILYTPYLVDEIVSSKGEVVIDKSPTIREYLPFEQETFRILRQGMTEVTNAVYSDGLTGTAAAVFKDFPVKVAGKTGTAQTGTSRPNHGFFVGYAPVDDPEIAVLVFLENGNSSAYTLPIAAGILNNYFGFDNEDLSETENIRRSPNKLLEFFREVFSGTD